MIDGKRKIIIKAASLAAIFLLFVRLVFAYTVKTRTKLSRVFAVAARSSAQRRSIKNL
jgi:hypothetical protein